MEHGEIIYSHTFFGYAEAYLVVCHAHKKISSSPYLVANEEQKKTSFLLVQFLFPFFYPFLLLCERTCVHSLSSCPFHSLLSTNINLTESGKREEFLMEYWLHFSEYYVLLQCHRSEFTFGKRERGRKTEYTSPF